MAWIEEKIKLLAEHGLADAVKPKNSAQKRFKQFLCKSAGKEIKSFDFAALEKLHKLKLPQDYKVFTATAGKKSFADVNGMVGTNTTVLPPAELDFKDYCSGKVPCLECEQAEIDGVVFANMDNGDAFVFDVSDKSSDYPVFMHDHEGNTLEPFAPNFAECIKRFAQKN